jgi:hypothetical protein
MKRLRAKSNSDIAKRLEKVFGAMEEQGISVDTSRSAMCTIVIDKKTGKEYSLEDMEEGSGWPRRSCPITDFPPVFDYHLIIDETVIHTHDEKTKEMSK